MTTTYTLSDTSSGRTQTVNLNFNLFAQKLTRSHLDVRAALSPLVDLLLKEDRLVRTRIMLWSPNGDDPGANYLTFERMSGVHCAWGDYWRVSFAPPHELAVKYVLKDQYGLEKAYFFVQS